MFVHNPNKKLNKNMGKGDIKSKRGKIARGTYGVRRTKNSTPAYVAPEKPVAKEATTTKKVDSEKPAAAKKTTAKKTTAKKTTAKKATTKKASSKK